MKKILSVAVLGSTGYVGLELVKILIRHPNIQIKFLGCENSPSKDIREFDQNIVIDTLPKLDLNNNFDPKNYDLVFLSLPHGVSHKFVKNFNRKIKIIDLSADFRLDSEKLYSKNYNNDHACPELLNQFIYGLPEINKDVLNTNFDVAVPGCYPTSVLIPLIPLLEKNLIKTDNIIIDSKSGYSGAGKKFDLNNIKNKLEFNFYNYNTNEHRHICEIQQELDKHSDQKVIFSFNPHILPIYRGLMSTIYCDLQENIIPKDVEDCLNKFAQNLLFVDILDNKVRGDFFKVQNTNKCLIKLYNQKSKSKIIIVSFIDNLLKGAAGQAVQCANLMFGFKENIGF